MDRALIVPVLVLLLGSLVAPATLAQAPPGPPSPHDAVRAFLSAFEDEGSCSLRGLALLLSRILGPLCEFEGRKLRAFYDTYLSSHSRARASPMQFARFFTDNAGRLSVRPGFFFSSRLSPELREPMYNDGRDLALVHALVSVHGYSSPRTEDQSIGNWIASMLIIPMRVRPNSYAQWRGNFNSVVEAVYLVIKEGTEWRLVLHEPVMRKMQELPPQPASPPSPALPYPALGQTAIAAEPVILYLMLFSGSLHSANLNTDESFARDFYHKYLASHTRGQITEPDFVAHWRDKALRQWLEPLGGPWRASRELILDYAVDTPQYNDTRDQARIRATITTRGGPAFGTDGPGPMSWRFA